MSDAERRQRILAAAEDLFFANGYAATSMDDVARSCGMSKKTIYLFFENKQALFAELIDVAIGALPRYMVNDDDHDVDGSDVIRNVLKELSAVLLNPRQLALARLVIAEAPHAPEIAESTRERGIDQAEKIVVDVLSKLHERGLIRGPADLELGRILLGATVGDFAFKMLIGLGRPPSDAEIAERIDRLLALLRGGAFGFDAAVPGPS
ncbi:TetR/AcrR family transcriptional regulator [Prosthecodimorpha staleyi]|uniref:TetR/AcrR family transcriptional regulator n=1 Tax=Prosthecodimorpha staleyi TaxID=2840188 RepID=UPI0021C2C581|nr:TetR/AcrR family transcriptional regulator [Prosthecodimorpha staleyi]